MSVPWSLVEPMIVWLNDALLPVEQLRIDPRDRGLLLGDGLFETLLAVRGRPVQLVEHLARMREGCALLNLPFRWSDDSVGQAVQAVLRANALADERAVARVTLSRGTGPRGLLPPLTPQPNLFILAAPAPVVTTPARAIISRYRRNEHSPLCRIKSLSYLESVLAAAEARERGADEALLLNSAGKLAEASAANVFLLREGRLSTPRLADGALPGIVRADVIALARDLGVEVHEEACSVADLRCAEEVFITNSVITIRSLRQLDGRELRPGRSGSLAARIRCAYEQRPGSSGVKRGQAGSRLAD